MVMGEKEKMISLETNMFIGILLLSGAIIGLTVLFVLFLRDNRARIYYGMSRFWNNMHAKK